jgi:hypothetical protein
MGLPHRLRRPRRRSTERPPVTDRPWGVRDAGVDAREEGRDVRVSSPEGSAQIGRAPAGNTHDEGVPSVDPDQCGCSVPEGILGRESASLSDTATAPFDDRGDRTPRPSRIEFAGTRPLPPFGQTDGAPYANTASPLQLARPKRRGQVGISGESSQVIANLERGQTRCIASHLVGREGLEPST